MNEEFFTVSEFNQFVKDVINAGFPQALWVCGEIQGFDRNRDKKHVFFELIEKDTTSQDIKARIGLVIFSNRRDFIFETLKKSENAFDLKDDIEVKFLCKVDFYQPHGALRLIVENIDPVYTLGKLAQEKQKLIALLKKNGILDRNKVHESPPVPLRIGLVTAYDSAAYNDFVSELKRSGYGFKIFLRNTLMQGKSAEKDICLAIDELEDVPQLDLIVITRGGGSIADLSCFDSEMIAKRVAICQLPVFSGIGHEINITVTDLAAHTYAKTPTAIAQLLVAKITGFLEAMEEKTSQICELAVHKIADEKQRLKNSAHGIQNYTHQYFKEHHRQLIEFAEAIKRRPSVVLKEQKILLKIIKDNLWRTCRQRLQHDRLRLSGHQKVIDIAHPVNTMKRGFSIARDQNGKVIKKFTAINQGDRMTTELFEGAIESEVTTTLKGEAHGRGEV